MVTHWTYQLPCSATPASTVYVCASRSTSILLMPTEAGVPKSKEHSEPGFSGQRVLTEGMEVGERAWAPESAAGQTVGQFLQIETSATEPNNDLPPISDTDTDSCSSKKKDTQDGVEELVPFFVDACFAAPRKLESRDEQIQFSHSSAAIAEDKFDGVGPRRVEPHQQGRPGTGERVVPLVSALYEEKERQRARERERERDLRAAKYRHERDAPGPRPADMHSGSESMVRRACIAAHCAMLSQRQYSFDSSSWCMSQDERPPFLDEGGKGLETEMSTQTNPTRSVSQLEHLDHLLADTRDAFLQVSPLLYLILADPYD